MANETKGFSKKYPMLSDVLVVAFGVLLATVAFHGLQTYVVPMIKGSADKA